MIYTLVYNGNYAYNLIEEKSGRSVTGGKFVDLSLYEKAIKEINELKEQILNKEMISK